MSIESTSHNRMEDDFLKGLIDKKVVFRLRWYGKTITAKLVAVGCDCILTERENGSAVLTRRNAIEQISEVVEA